MFYRGLSHRNVHNTNKLVDHITTLFQPSKLHSTDCDGKLVMNGGMWTIFKEAGKTYLKVLLYYPTIHPDRISKTVKSPSHDRQFCGWESNSIIHEYKSDIYNNCANLLSERFIKVHRTLNLHMRRNFLNCTPTL